MSDFVSVVSGPAANPWDPFDIAARALDVLRLSSDDADAERMVDLARTAGELIDGHLDMPVPYVVIPDGVLAAAVTVTVEQYRRKDAPFGLTDSWSADGTFQRIPSDPLRGVYGVLSRYKARVGVA